MAKYNLTNKAVEDISKIWEYTYEVWSESQADKYYELLTKSFQALVQNPGLGKNYNEIDRQIMGLRIGKHVIFYRVAQSKDIEILRILHQESTLKAVFSNRVSRNRLLMKSGSRRIPPSVLR